MRKINYLIEYPLPEMNENDKLWWIWAMKAFPKWRNQFTFRLIQATNYRD